MPDTATVVKPDKTGRLQGEAFMSETHATEEPSATGPAGPETVSAQEEETDRKKAPARLARLQGLLRLLPRPGRKWPLRRHMALKVLLFWLFSAGALWSLFASGNIHRLQDTDDALRLVQWRLFRDGAAWHDLLITRMAPPEGLLSHWSRLVDAGLMALHAPLSWLLPPAQAETFMRLLWPLILLLAALAAVAVIARELGGRHAATAALLLAALALPTQFLPGRIDHHNAQITLTLLAWAFLFPALRRARLMAASGFFMVMALAIGLEAMPFVLPVAAIPLWGWLRGWKGHDARMRYFGISLSVAAFIFLISAQPPSRLTATACDTYAANLAFPLALTGMLMVALSFIPARLRAIRLMSPALAILTILAAAALFVWLDPACLKSPFATLPREVKAAWLDHVKELQPVFRLAAQDSGGHLWLIHLLWPALALALFALVRPLRRLSPDKRAAARLLATTALISLLLGSQSARLVIYAQWLAIPLIAPLITPSTRRFTTMSAPARLLPAAMASPLAFLIGTQLLLSPPEATARMPGPADSPAGPGRFACSDERALKPLAELPAGLLAADITLQPHVLAHTQHRVLAGPYHRIAGHIRENIYLFSDPPEQARRRAHTLGLRYIVLCPGARVNGPNGRPVGPHSLWRQLLDGNVPAWLAPVPLRGETPLRVYRVRAARRLPPVIDVPDVLLNGIRPREGHSSPRDKTRH
jgi:hypothetical protein